MLISAIGLTAILRADDHTDVLRGLASAKLKATSLPLTATAQIEVNLGSNTNLTLGFRGRLSSLSAHLWRKALWDLIEWSSFGNRWWYQTKNRELFYDGHTLSERFRPYNERGIAADWNAVTGPLDPDTEEVDLLVDPLLIGYRWPQYYDGRQSVRKPWIAVIALHRPPKIHLRSDGKVELEWEQTWSDRYRRAHHDESRDSDIIVVDPKRGYMVESSISRHFDPISGKNMVNDRYRVLSAKEFEGLWVPSVFEVANGGTSSGRVGPYRVTLSQINVKKSPHLFRSPFQIGDLKSDLIRPYRLQEDGSWQPQTTFAEEQRNKEDAEESGLIQEYFVWVAGLILVVAGTSAFFSRTRSRRNTPA